ncbi:MAG: hypothetical protein ACYCVG_06460 [Leptospirillum sp.]
MNTKKWSESLKGKATFLLTLTALVVFSDTAWAGDLFEDAPSSPYRGNSDFLEYPVSHQVLSNTRGMGGFSFTNDGQISATLNGTLSSTVTSSQMNNNISGHALGSASGVVNVIQNTGSNVVIQNLVQLNVSMH